MSQSNKNELTFFRRKKKRLNPAVLRDVLSWLFGIFTAIFIAAVLIYFFGMSTDVVGTSMEPTLYHGQRILIDRFSYLLASPKEGAVVVFLPHGNQNSHYYVKRVVALPGDTVKVERGVLYVNGEESAFVERTVEDGGIAANGLVLGPDEYFCIGDSPQSSEDSRSANIGPVNKSDMIGKAWFSFASQEGDWGFIR